MGEVIFCATNDGSAGLFNKSVDDIYHSSYGAYSESYEKFLVASGYLEFIKTHDEVKILDVCYGIGYNTKVALDEILKLDKLMTTKIDALEYDKNLVHISPILKHQKIDDIINEFLIENGNFDKKYSTISILKSLYRMHGAAYINWANLSRFMAFKIMRTMSNIPGKILAAFYHNIYYNYIAPRKKKGLKWPKLLKTSIKFHFSDARVSVKKLDGEYDFIFLDAFTPKKLPTLWSLEFFKELFRLLDDNGVLVTYSSSAAVRSAMVEAGFCIGRSIDANGKIIGTIAAKHQHLIKYELEEFDKELLKSRAGIYYRDDNLDATPEELNARRDNEVANSNRITSSRLKKLYAKK